MTHLPTLSREAALPVANPLGLEGIEFVEFSTPRPQALGHLLEAIGFRPVARHRSREVLRYRQGGMNIVVNGHGQGYRPQGHGHGHGHGHGQAQGLPPEADAMPQIAAIGLRVADAAAAFRRAVDAGAWPVAVQVEPMELHIPGVHGVGSSRFYFIDRWREFSIYDVDFVPIPTVQPEVPAVAGLHWFGAVQYVGAARAADWSAFYQAIFGYRVRPDDERAGILPAGTVLASPCGSFWIQLVEPATDSAEADESGECLQRMAFGTHDVAAAVAAWQTRGVAFVDAAGLAPTARGALTRPALGGVCFELVQHPQPHPRRG